MFKRLGWYLRQLVPSTFRSHYIQDEKRHFVVWNMWLGRSFNIEDVVTE